MNKVIYLVDDDEDLRDIMKIVLTEENYTVLSFNRADLALEELKKTKLNEIPDLIFVDYYMPQMSGVEFIYNLKEFHPDTLGKIPLVLCSAMGEVNEGVKLPSEVKLLAKPMDLDVFLQLAAKLTHS